MRTLSIVSLLLLLGLLNGCGEKIESASSGPSENTIATAEELIGLSLTSGERQMMRPLLRLSWVARLPC